MKYISDIDYSYIMNDKYPKERFSRKDDAFSEATGLSPDEIYRMIPENDRKYYSLSHPERKARSLEYILENTRISCDRRDRFPAINMTDRPLNKTLIAIWNSEVFKEIIPDVGAKRSRLERDGIVTIWPDYDHSVPVWSKLFTLGISGILEECERARHSRTLTAEEEAFFEGIRITYEAIISFTQRLSELAYATTGSERMAEALSQLSKKPPRSFYEALLLSYLYFIISEHIDSLQVRSLSGFDEELYSFYKNDLSRGISEEEIREDLAYYFLQFTAIGNYFNQPVFLGGERADGETVINELSYLFLDVYDKMGIYNPKIQIKVSDSTPKPFIMKALDMIRRGNNCIVFVSDNTMRKALMAIGATPDEARTCNVTGCYEYSVKGSYSSGMNYLNMLKPLEYALHGGHDGVTGVFSGERSPRLCEYTAFDRLFDEYKRQLLEIIKATVETVNGFEGYLSLINPLSLLSATFDSSVARARDAIGGGALYNDSILLFGFLADVSDSLMMIKKYVYERGEISLNRLVSVLDNNFEGEDRLRLLLLHDREKYGNNKERPDEIASQIVTFICENLIGVKNSRGGIWYPGFHVARMSYDQAKHTAASPNGRRLGEELSKNVSASMGQSKEGATAAILSATKLGADRFASDAALDLGLLPSSVSGDDGLSAMYGLLMTFIGRGGHAIHINVFNADMLREAQAHPEKYNDLQIRVCGWNVLWNNIKKKEQDGFIRQAEALI